MTKSVIVLGNKIQISFPYDLALLAIVRDLPDRDFDGAGKVWTMPFTPFHAAKATQVLKPLGFWLDPTLATAKDHKAIRPKTKLPANLFDYQKEGVEFLYAANGRAIVGDDMGLGKTAECLVYTDYFTTGRVLVIAPANVLYKWAEKEIPMWTKGKTAQVVEGKDAISDADYIIMSYEIATRRVEELNRIPFKTVLVDEAHYLKNAKALRTKAIKKLVKGVPRLMLITGTPFKNKRIELYQLLNMVDSRNFSNVKTFGERYCGGQLVGGAWITPPDKETNTEELKDRLSAIMLRRTKKEVGSQLPELTRISLPVEIDRAPYNKIMKSVDRSERAQPAEMLALLNKLRHAVGLAKVPATLELAEGILDQGEKVVIFAYHKDVVAAYAAKLSKYGVGVISGDTPSKERQRQVEVFLGSKATLIQSVGMRCMIITTAGAEGIDLYSSSHLIMAERVWTPATEEQVEARLHRNGQRSNVTVHYVVARGTVDVKLDEIVRRKRGEFSRLIESDIIQELWKSL